MAVAGRMLGNPVQKAVPLRAPAGFRMQLLLLSLTQSTCLPAANSSRLRPRSFRWLEAYRPASARTNSSRVAMLICPMSAPADTHRWGAS